MVYYYGGEVKSVLQSLGVRIAAETDKRYNCLCPFHSNTDTPAFSISKTEGLWICFNEACARAGNLEQLVAAMSDRTELEALRYIDGRKQQHAQQDLSTILDEAFAPEPEWPVFPEQVVQQLVDNFWTTPKAHEYMLRRHFDKQTLRHFQLGYSPKSSGQVVYPVHTPNGKICVGIVGRGIDSKFFDNSKNLPKRKVLFNLHRARVESSKVVVVESGFDAMRLHQAGHPNAVATLGAAITDEQLELLERNFTDIIVFSDNDDAGFAMRKRISDSINRASVLHASAEYGKLYPSEGLDAGVPKDAGDLRLDQITQMVHNPRTSFEAGLP